MKLTFLTVSALLFQAAQLAAQTWPEAGDAGDLPRSAQVPVGYGPLTAIAGDCTDGVDLFLIQIDDPATFTASTVGGASFDTKLSLFDERGFGVTMRDDIVFPGNLQSTLTGQFVRAPGRYFLAVSSSFCEAQASLGRIWSPLPYDVERKADGLRPHEALTGWALGTSGSSYTITLTGCSFPAQQIVMPDENHLSESPGVIASSGSTNWWRAGGGRFQLLYEASHFASAGATGPIAIKKLRFRGEDGEINRGGATWSGAFVQIGATSLSTSSLSTAFATNRGSSVTTLAPAAITDVTMAPSVGSTPNNYNIEIDLEALGATLALDPTSSRPNLLIDVILPNAAVVPPAAGPVMSMQDGGSVLVRAAGVNTAASSGTTGNFSQSPLVVGLDIVGTGGNRLVVPARNEYFGAACGGQPSAFYQAFLNGQRFDLRGLQLLPDDGLTPTKYTVGASNNGVDATKVGATPDSIDDDALVTHALGFTFRYPGGSTTTIRACTNGFVWLDGVSPSSDLSPTTAELLGVGGYGARLAPFWTDLHCGRNTSTHPNSGLHVVTDTSGGAGHAKCYVTWLDVGLFNTVAAGGTAVVRMQCVLGEDGSVEYRYTTMPQFCGTSTTEGTAVLVGFSRGVIGASPSLDPVSRDLSLEVPFSTSPEGTGGNLHQTVTANPFDPAGSYGARAFANQQMRWNIGNVPAGAVLGAQLIDIEPSRPGLALPGITAPGCVLSTSANAMLWEVHLLPASTVNGTRSLVIPPGFDGFEIYAQYVVLDGLFGGPSLISASSNAVRTVVGRN